MASASAPPDSAAAPLPSVELLPLRALLFNIADAFGKNFPQPPAYLYWTYTWFLCYWRAAVRCRCCHCV
eukprot:11169221-Lingulodinium_polyedra.AAC.1